MRKKNEVGSHNVISAHRSEHLAQFKLSVNTLEQHHMFIEIMIIMSCKYNNLIANTRVNTLGPVRTCQTRVYHM